MKRSKAAIRYAKSLLDLARERNKLNEAQEDMEIVAKAIDENRELELLLESPIIKSDKKLAILKEIFEDKIGPVSFKFISIITQKGREGLLLQIAQQLIIICKEDKNIYSAEVTSATPLSDSVREKIYGIVQGIRPGEIELKETINKDLIGGFVLRVGDKMIDSSVRTKFKELKREFTDNPYISEM